MPIAPGASRCAWLGALHRLLTAESFLHRCPAVPAAFLDQLLLYKMYTCPHCKSRQSIQLEPQQETTLRFQARQLLQQAATAARESQEAQRAQQATQQQAAVQAAVQAAAQVLQQHAQRQAQETQQQRAAAQQAAAQQAAAAQLATYQQLAAAMAAAAAGAQRPEPTAAVRC